MDNETEHIPVLLKEVIENLNLKDGGRYIDATLGFGGHTQAIIDQGGRVLGIEWDPEVLKSVEERLTPWTLRARGRACPGAPRLVLIEGNFAEVKEIAKRNNFCPVDGVVFDLGISFWHYKKAKRGFSFKDQKLDMRISPHLPVTALDIVNQLSYEQLSQIFIKLAQEKLADPIAQALVRARRLKPISSAQELTELVAKIYRRYRVKTKYQPATKVFLALRIIVNHELDNLKRGLRGAIEILKEGGRLLVITFNSTEDRIVKQFLKQNQKLGRLKNLQLVFPCQEEINRNPLARSAKLRVVVKI